MTASIFQGRHLLSTRDYTKDELMWLIGFAEHLKDLKKRNIPHHYLEGKNVALLFEKTSTRTRAAFTTACIDLGAHPEYLGKNDIQLGKKETVLDTARVLGSMFDAIEFRGFKQEHVEQLAEYSGVPVWNGLTDREIVALAQKFAVASGATIRVTNDPVDAVKGADAVYTNVWAAMGEESQFAERVRLMSPFQVNAELVSHIENPDWIFLHCLPAFHNAETEYAAKIRDEHGIEAMEVTDDVIYSEHSLCFQEAENRMHTIKAIMAATLGNLYVPRV